MKILYVGDNRDRENWGCRATSKALQVLITEDNELIETINGKEVAAWSASKTEYSTLLPMRVFMAIKNRRKNFLFDWAYKIISKKSIETDYLKGDLDESISFFEKYNHYYPHLAKINNQINACDALVVNGEGDMIFTTPERRNALFYLMLLKLAKKRGKKIFYLNAMISDCPATGRNEKTVSQMLDIFSTCDGINVRDLQSYRILSEVDKNKIVKFEYIPDALFSWNKYFSQPIIPPIIGDSIIPFPEGDEYFDKFDFTKPYICISGSSSAAWEQKKSEEGYLRLVQKLKQLNIQMYLVVCAPGDNFLKAVSIKTGVPLIPVNISVIMGAIILANAKLFISGRFHPSILASLGGTPCVFMGSNSHKTFSLQEVLGYENPMEYNGIPTEEDVELIFQDSIKILKEEETLRKKIKAKVNWLAKDCERIKTLV